MFSEPQSYIKRPKRKKLPLFCDFLYFCRIPLPGSGSGTITTTDKPMPDRNIPERTAELFFALYQEKDRYISVAMSYIQDMEKARDIVSDSFAYMLERKESLPEDLPRLKGYLMLTVKHRCLDALKHLAARENALKNLYEADMEMLGNDNVTEKIMERDMEWLLAQAGVRMKRQTFDILVSSRLEGMSHKEIAGKFGISEGRVAKEIMQAMKVLKKLFKDYLHIVMPLLLMSGRLNGW